MDTQEFNKFLFKKIKKDLEKILTTQYKKYNFDIQRNNSKYKSIDPFHTVFVSCSIGSNHAFDLAEKYSGFNSEKTDRMEINELRKYFTNNLEEYKKYNRYNDILNHFDFPANECYGNVSAHIYNFINKYKLDYWISILIENREEIKPFRRKEHLHYADYFYHQYDKLPIEVQKKGKTIYSEFELIKELKKEEKISKLKENLEKSLPINNKPVKVTKI